MASNSKNLAELLNSDVTITATDIADGAVSTAKLADGAVTAPKTSGVGKKKNYIINGDMRINQRGQTGSTALTGGGVWISDRFFSQVGGTSIGVNGTRSGDVPNNTFSTSSKFAVVAAATANDHNTRITTRLEGYAAKELGIGVSGNKITLSFYVKSTRTGTHGVTLSTGYRSGTVFDQAGITLTYTIDAASTWERKTITFDSYDTGGSAVWQYDHNLGIEICFTLGQGSGVGTMTATNTWQDHSTDYIYPKSTGAGGEDWGTSTSDLFNITGVQLEAGDTASDWEHPDIGQELRLCQRYYETSRDGLIETKASLGGGAMTGQSEHPYNGTGLAATSREGDRTFFKVTKRSIPSVIPYSYNGTANAYSYITGGGTSTDYNIRVRHEGFNMYKSTASGLWAWFDWTGDAEL